MVLNAKAVAPAIELKTAAPSLENVQRIYSVLRITWHSSAKKVRDSESSRRNTLTGITGGERKATGKESNRAY